VAPAVGAVAGVKLGCAAFRGFLLRTPTGAATAKRPVRISYSEENGVLRAFPRLPLPLPALLTPLAARRWAANARARRGRRRQAGAANNAQPAALRGATLPCSAA